ncbi:hypothetical protein B296_00014844 [Ensete ventricosum]|uniref:Uncharacterized protein n=1 Tax=Ensete ventricosum TaxID=4639 RepID=A0A427B7E2_ENSVE|nr:hypothetical protein B296_00014844 [Ensete ventricosum]
MKKKPSPRFHLERRKGVMAERARMQRVASVPSSNSSPVRHSIMLSRQSDLMGIQPKASSSPAPPPLPPSAIVRKKTKTTTRARRGSKSPTWAMIPSFTVNRDLPDHSGHNPSTAYRIPPDGARTHPLLRSAQRSVSSCPSTSNSLLRPTSTAASSSSPLCSSSSLPADTTR